MTTYSHKRISNGWLILGLLLGMAGLALGAFADLPIDQMVFDPYKVWARLLAAFAPAPLFWGVGAAGLLTLDVTKDKSFMFLGWLFALICNLVGPVYMYTSILEEYPAMVNGSWILAWALAFAVCILPVLLYWVLMRKADKAAKIKCIVILLVVCGGAMAGVQILKRIWLRPRFTTLEQYTEIPFQTFYELGRSEVLANFKTIYETSHDLFYSFPSAHTASAACLFVWALIPCFTKKGSVTLAMIVAYAGTLATMFSRLVVGQHFLSDVSAGFLITFILFCLCCWIFGLTRHDESMYEYDDDEDLDERTTASSSRSKKRSARSRFEEDEDDEDDDLFDDEPARKSRSSRRSAVSNARPAKPQSLDEDDEDGIQTVPLDYTANSAVIREEDTSYPDHADETMLVNDEDGDAETMMIEEDDISTMPLESKPAPSRKSRKNRSAADLFDDSIFE